MHSERMRPEATIECAERKDSMPCQHLLFLDRRYVRELGIDVKAAAWRKNGSRSTIRNAERSDLMLCIACAGCFRFDGLEEQIRTI